MRKKAIKYRWLTLGAFFCLLLVLGVAFAQDMAKSSYSPVVIKEPFSKTMARMKAAKVGLMQRQMDLLNERYDLSNRPAKDVMMSGGIKAIQEGVRAKLSEGMTWEKLAEMTP